MVQEDYRQFICRRIGPSCGFQVQARTEEEVMEHVRVHAAAEHGMKEMSPEMEKKVKESIEPVKVTT
jgi:predicted small metal-binding protein